MGPVCMIWNTRSSLLVTCSLYCIEQALHVLCCTAVRNRWVADHIPSPCLFSTCPDGCGCRDKTSLYVVYIDPNFKFRHGKMDSFEEAASTIKTAFEYPYLSVGMYIESEMRHWPGWKTSVFSVSQIRLRRLGAASRQIGHQETTSLHICLSFWT